MSKIKEEYQRQGFFLIRDLIAHKQVKSIMSEFNAITQQHPEFGATPITESYWNDIPEKAYWFKSLHQVSSEIRKLALSVTIKQAVMSLLAQPINLWGSQILIKPPHKVHRWHVDVESFCWTTVNVWIALENATFGNCLKLIPGSHRYQITPQMLATSYHLDLSLDADVIGHAKEIEPAAEIVELDMKPGDAVIFEGKIWHGSKNITQLERYAALLQYSPQTDYPKIPISFDVPYRFHEQQPYMISI